MISFHLNLDLNKKVQNVQLSFKPRQLLKWDEWCCLHVQFALNWIGPFQLTGIKSFTPSKPSIRLTDFKTELLWIAPEPLLIVPPLTVKWPKNCQTFGVMKNKPNLEFSGHLTDLKWAWKDRHCWYCLSLSWMWHENYPGERHWFKFANLVIQKFPHLYLLEMERFMKLPK